jgi:hypothetical protein
MPAASTRDGTRGQGHLRNIAHGIKNINYYIDFVKSSWYIFQQRSAYRRREPDMTQTYDVDGACPVCGDAMMVTRLSCGRCGSSLEGAFRLSALADGSTPSRSGPLSSRADDARFGRLARLDQTQLEFVETFLRCRGVIKNVEDMLGISYPTVKSRLASVLETMGLALDDDQPAVADVRRIRREILADLAAGRITTAEAHRKLAENSATDGDGGDGTGE